MKIAFGSDYHLEFMKKSQWRPSFHGEDLLILAGDIQVGMTQEYWFAELLKYRDVIAICGNHEFYNHQYSHIIADMPSFEEKVNKIAKEKGFKYNFRYLHNQTVTLHGVKFIGSTLWTNFNDNNPLIRLAAQQGMNDYHSIRLDMDMNYKLNVDFIYEEHMNAREFINQELNNYDGIKFVISHHAPSELSVHEKYKNMHDYALNFCYFSNLEAIAEKANFWIHGHTHNSFKYNLGKCKVLCNPRGYNHPSDLNKEFKEDLIIEI